MTPSTWFSSGRFEHHHQPPPPRPRQKPGGSRKSPAGSKRVQTDLGVPGVHQADGPLHGRLGKKNRAVGLRKTCGPRFCCCCFFGDTNLKMGCEDGTSAMIDVPRKPSRGQVVRRRNILVFHAKGGTC